MRSSVAAQCCGLPQPTYLQVIEIIAVGLRSALSLYTTYIDRRLGRGGLNNNLNFSLRATSQKIRIWVVR